MSGEGKTIPEGIIATAQDVFAGLNTNNYDADCTCSEKADDILAIATAIHDAVMAETQRCWGIANAAYRANATGSGFDSQPARATAYEIREAIRSIPLPAAPKTEY